MRMSGQVWLFCMNYGVYAELCKYAVAKVQFAFPKVAIVNGPSNHTTHTDSKANALRQIYVFYISEKECKLNGKESFIFIYHVFFLISMSWILFLHVNTINLRHHLPSFFSFASKWCLSSTIRVSRKVWEKTTAKLWVRSMCASVQVLFDTFLQNYLTLRFTNAEKTMVNYVHKSVQCGQIWGKLWENCDQNIHFSGFCTKPPFKLCLSIVYL